MDLSRQSHRRYYVANCMINDRGEFQPPLNFFADSREEALELIRIEFMPRGIKPSNDGRSYLTEFCLSEVNQELKELGDRVSKSKEVYFTRLTPDLQHDTWKSADEFFSGRRLKSCEPYEPSS